VNDRKSVSGLPLPGRVPRPGVMSAEARIARRRLWRRHHLYHHGLRIGPFAFGLTSGVWDRVYGTHVPPLAAPRRFATSSAAEDRGPA